MKTFEIQYISRYYDEKNYNSETIKAKTEEDVLKKFAKLFGIKNFKQLFEPMYMWEDGQWMSSFKYINEVEEIVCEHCNGSGKIQINKKKNGSK